MLALSDDSVGKLVLNRVVLGHNLTIVLAVNQNVASLHIVVVVPVGALLKSPKLRLLLVNVIVRDSNKPGTRRADNVRNGSGAAECKVLKTAGTSRNHSLLTPPAQDEPQNLVILIVALNVDPLVAINSNGPLPVKEKISAVVAPRADPDLLKAPGNALGHNGRALTKPKGLGRLGLKLECLGVVSTKVDLLDGLLGNSAVNLVLLIIRNGVEHAKPEVVNVALLSGAGLAVITAAHVVRVDAVKRLLILSLFVGLRAVGAVRLVKCLHLLNGPVATAAKALRVANGTVAVSAAVKVIGTKARHFVYWSRTEEN